MTTESDIAKRNEELLEEINILKEEKRDLIFALTLADTLMEKYHPYDDVEAYAISFPGDEAGEENTAEHAWRREIRMILARLNVNENVPY